MSSKSTQYRRNRKKIIKYLADNFDLEAYLSINKINKNAINCSNSEPKASKNCQLSIPNEDCNEKDCIGDGK